MAAMNIAMKIFLPILLVLCSVVPLFAQTEEYVLKAGDVISVSVVEHPEFSGRHKIRPDGKINYPVIGEIEVASLTCAQLVKIMQGKLASYINNPVVSVAIESYFANVIYLIGDIGRTGQVEIYEPIDVMKVIAISGGLKNPRTKIIKIIRADGTIVNVNVADIWGTETKRDPRKYVLYPGDTLYVPHSFSVPWALIATILSIITASLTLYLTIDRISSK
jgi:polysaccharide export outer membrane protein